ncbi:DUF5641 domain-containing protein [Trichonephila clavata]|uniref:DUF5641 domain-containing protein n=1 Tax=Trichonephila clavata TaxID=2740835 RepID=A0A8X6H6U9_TRICU|nr:DUF5641 domain-containing protein [Trichonephila clavata]
MLWSDSTVALSWIQGDPNRWKTFVCNRTTEILQYTTPSQWRHCTGTDNPADNLTRGTFPSQLPSLESWWHGPKWLNHDSDACPPPKDFPSHSQPLVEVESRKTESLSFYVANTEPIIDISHEESLSTVLTGIEAALNSRPLVYEEESDDNSAALTPAHFLTGRKLTAIPSRLENTRLNKIYKQQQDLLDCFWKKWSKKYLLQLRSFHQVRNKDSTINIRVGDIVLLQEGVRLRNMWKKARVMNLHQGRDGKIRSCELRINGRNVTRPVQLVIPLEIDQGGEDVGNKIKSKV